MSVASYIPDDLFVVRTVKAHANNPDDKWANTYEVRAILGGSTDELLALALALVEFERMFHMGFVQFVSLGISTWEADSKPYNPETFISTPLATSGLNATPSDAVSVNQCLSIARIPPYGRFGHIFYRGCLTEIDVASPAGKSVFQNKPEQVTRISGAIITSGIDEYIGTGAAGLQLVMVNKSGSQIRPILGLVPVGVAHVPSDHAWYNRTTTP